MSDDAADSPNDYIADVRGQWETIFPDLDTSMVAVMGRIARIAQVVQVRSDEVLAAQGVTRGEFSFFLTSSPCSPDMAARCHRRECQRQPIISGAGVTKRLKRLGSAGLVSRIPDPADGRGSLVQLTDTAWDLLRPILEFVLGFENRLLADLGLESQEQLAGSLRELLISSNT